jgi:hypothetical protein
MIFSGFWWDKNKPNQSQFKPNLSQIKANLKPKQTQTKPILAAKLALLRRITADIPAAAERFV